MIELNLPPVRKGDWSPAGCPRNAYPQLTDDEYMIEVCRVDTERKKRQ